MFDYSRPRRRDEGVSSRTVELMDGKGKGYYEGWRRVPRGLLDDLPSGGGLFGGRGGTACSAMPCERERERVSRGERGWSDELDKS